MNKVQYMRILEEELQALPQQEKEEALMYVAEYFDDSGLEEWEVAIQLGDPYEYAGNIKEELAGTPPPYPYSHDKKWNSRTQSPSSIPVSLPADAYGQDSALDHLDPERGSSLNIQDQPEPEQPARNRRSAQYSWKRVFSCYLK